MTDQKPEPASILEQDRLAQEQADADKAAHEAAVEQAQTGQAPAGNNKPAAATTDNED